MGTSPNQYEGYLDSADCNFISGWAADHSRLNQSINVDIYDGSTLIASVPANQSRSDVAGYLHDNGLHGFTVATPASLKDGNAHSIIVKYGGASSSLGSSPRNLMGCSLFTFIISPGSGQQLTTTFSYTGSGLTP